MKLICELYEICLVINCDHRVSHEYIETENNCCTNDCPLEQDDIKINVSVEELENDCVPITRFRKQKLEKINSERILDC